MNIFKATNPSMVGVNSFAMSSVVIQFFIVVYLALIGSGLDWFMIGSVLLVWQFFNVVGIAAGAHRYFSHRAFECNRFWQWFMAYFCMVSLVGPPCIWADAHHKHHRYSDTEDDPYTRFMLSGHNPFSHTTSVSKRFIAKVVKDDILHYYTLKYFWLYVISYVVFCGIVGWFAFGQTEPLVVSIVKGIFAFWLLPAGLSQLTLRLVLWTGHLKKLGYRNYNTSDTSNNSWIMSLIAAGEGWHNNHHFAQRSPTTKVKWWEVDITWWFIKLIKKKGS